MGMRVSLTLLALAHFSMMSREASWIGFFMYPTLISFSWAEEGAVATPRASTMAVTAPARVRAPTRSRIDIEFPPGDFAVLAADPLSSCRSIGRPELALLATPTPIAQGCPCQ